MADMMFLPHSWLDQCQHGQIRARSVFINQNLASVGGYTQSLQLNQVIQELILDRDSVTDGRCAVQQVVSMLKTFLGIPF